MARVLKLLEAQSAELRAVDVGNHVDRVHVTHLSPLEFATQYVARNKPVIITGALDSWPALTLFTSEYLSHQAGVSPITVDLTPHGRADSVTCVCRCMAHGGAAHVAMRATSSHAGCCMERVHGQRDMTAAAAHVPQHAVQQGGPGPGAKMQAPQHAEQQHQGVATVQAPAAQAGPGTQQQPGPGVTTHAPQHAVQQGSPGTQQQAVLIKADTPHTAQQGGPGAQQQPLPGAEAQQHAHHDLPGGTQQQQQPHEASHQQEKWFLMPCEVKMTVRSFFHLLRESRQTSGPTRMVPYVQHQNSSFTEEWSFLSQDTQPHLDWADKVFGAPPAATNLWIGDERSVTSFHKDAFENLYAVVRGTKVFHLLPPSDAYRMNLRRYPAAVLKLDERGSQVPDANPIHSTPDTAVGAAPHTAGVYSLFNDHGSLTTPQACGEANTPSQPYNEANQGSVIPPMHPCDPPPTQGSNSPSQPCHQANVLVLGQSQLMPELKQPPSQVLWSNIDLGQDLGHDLGQEGARTLDPKLPEPLVAEVGPGEVLFLPALWYHRVSQVCSEKDHHFVLAVNFWYDMAFDHRWTHFQLIEGLAQHLGLADPPPDI